MLVKLIIRNVLFKPLASILSIILLALGIGIISMVLILQNQLQQKFDRDLEGIDLVVGAKGSPLQLILSSVYHIDAPTGNIKLKDIGVVTNNPIVELAIPLAYGDSYKGFRIVGTDSNYIAKYKAVYKEGNLFAKPFEVVIGFNLQQEGLKVGSSFKGNHGLSANGEEHDDLYKVVGVLQPTNTVLDNLILTNIETVWDVHHHNEKPKSSTEKQSEVHNHEHEDAHEHEEEENAEITAMLVKFRGPMGIITMPRMINQTTNLQAAVPALEINRLFNIMGIGSATISAIAGAIVIVSGFSFFIALYNRLKERKYELALLRTMGMSKVKMFAMILAESLLLSVIGFFIGLGISRLGIWLVLDYLPGGSRFLTFSPAIIEEEYFLFAMSIAIGILASLLPAIKAYRLNISKTLSNV